MGIERERYKGGGGDEGCLRPTHAQLTVAPNTRAAHRCAQHTRSSPLRGLSKVSLPPTSYFLRPTSVLPTAWSLLPTAYIIRPAAYCLLPTAYCLLPTVYGALEQLRLCVIAVLQYWWQ